MRRLLPCALAILACLAGAFVAPAAAESETCGIPSDLDVIAACTRLIASGTLKGRDLAATLVSRGKFYAASREYDRAIGDYDRAIGLDPKNAVAFHSRGVVYTIKEQPDRAIADFDQAIRLDPKYAIAFHNRGVAYDEKHETDRAIADFSEAIRLGKVAAAFIGRGNLYQAKGDLDRARADFNAALALQDSEWARKAALDGLASLTAGQAPAVAAAPAAATAAIAPVAPAGPVIAERRVALVIGNSAYLAVSALPNPTNDARGVADAFKAAGFWSVRIVADATRDAMIQALRAFQDEADAADWAVVYYAGHGMEIGGVNYLVPTDARLKVDRDAQDEAVPLNRVLDAISGAKKLKLVMLDACRENPFAQQMRRTMAMRAVSRGLARIEPDGATLVVYAAKDGELAADGTGDHSPFTTALLRRLQQPGIEINRLFRLVTGDVLLATNSRQRPFVYGSIPGDEEFYFKLR
jgi:uncharacterized caspase-like protein